MPLEYNDWRKDLAQSRADRDAQLGNWRHRGITSSSGFSQEYEVGFSDSTVSQETAVLSNESMNRMLELMRMNSLGGFSSPKTSEKAKTKKALQVLDKVKASAKPMRVEEKQGDSMIEQAAEYRALGLEYMARVIEKKGMLAWKEFAIAGAGYKRINRAELDAFKEELYNSGDTYSKRTLMETPLERYIGQNHGGEGVAVVETELGVPPADVLEKLKVARDSKLFDAFSVLHIQYVPDPILCGKIEESQDLYFIAEWGDDVKLADIVK